MIILIVTIVFAVKEEKKVKYKKLLKEIFLQAKIDAKEGDFKIIKDYKECKGFTFTEEYNCTNYPRIDYEYKGRRGVIIGEIGD